jgi:hypothetical protein
MQVGYDIDIEGDRAMEELKAAMTEIAAELKRLPGAIPEELRLRLIEVRSQLFTRGYFDPILARFDGTTVPRASNAEIAEELGKLAAA